jgi:hypothetical protein
VNVLLPLLLLHGAARADTDPAADYQPLSIYLDEATVLSVVHGASHRFVGCFEPPTPTTPDASDPAAFELELHIARSGAVSQARVHVLEAEHPPLDCLQQTACGLGFPAHDEPLERWRYQLTWAEGEVHPYPRATRLQRPRGPLFLLLPPLEDLAQRSALEQRLGFAPSPPPPAPLSAACPPPSGHQPDPDSMDTDAHEQGDL